jgi:hypothetical protein
MNRWKAIEEKVGGLEVVLETSLAGWAVYIIRESASSELQAKNGVSSSSSKNTTPVVDETVTHQPTTTHQPATAQAFAERNRRQSHSSSSREYTSIPKAPLPRLAPPPGPTWKFQVTETRVYGKADLRDMPAVFEFLNVSRICDDASMYQALAGYGEGRYTYI